MCDWTGRKSLISDICYAGKNQRGTGHSLDVKGKGGIEDSQVPSISDRGNGGTFISNREWEESFG